MGICRGFDSGILYGDFMGIMCGNFKRGCGVGILVGI